MASDRGWKARYKKVNNLGEGGFGRAFLVEDKADGVRYVIKEMGLQGRRRSDIEDCKREAEILQLLHHPNIVAYKESWADDICFYLVMEYATHGDLQTEIKRRLRDDRRFEADEIYKLVTELLLALQYCHSRRVLHRDIKAANIFLNMTEDGSLQVKLGDFGVSKVLQKEEDIAQTYAGTIPMMAPEMLMGTGHTSKVDVWSLGCVAYQLCAMREPFVWTGAASEAALKRRIAFGQYDPLPAAVEPGLQELVRLMLTIQPRDRPSVDQLLRHGIVVHHLRSLEIPAVPGVVGPSRSGAGLGVASRPSQGAVAAPAASAAPETPGVAGVGFSKGGRGFRATLPSPPAAHAAPPVVFSKSGVYKIVPNLEWREEEQTALRDQLKVLLEAAGRPYQVGEVDPGFDGGGDEETEQPPPGIAEAVQARLGKDQRLAAEIQGKFKKRG